MVNFYWGYKGDSLCMHLLNHRHLFIPKCFGGLGLRDFWIVNKALLAKQFWRFVANLDLLVSKWVDNKYLVPSLTLRLDLRPVSIRCNSEHIMSHLKWRLGSSENLNYGIITLKVPLRMWKLRMCLTITLILGTNIDLAWFVMLNLRHKNSIQELKKSFVKSIYLSTYITNLAGKKNIAGEGKKELKRWVSLVSIFILVSKAWA